MPRPGPRKPLIAIRIHPALRDRIDEIATQAGVTRSELVRRMIVDALPSAAVGVATRATYADDMHAPEETV